MTMSLLFITLLSFVHHVKSESMDCGTGVELCGVLTLESGYGSGNYEHPEPVVHGLWPEVGNYGSSQCLEPADFSDPSVVYTCYDQRGETESQCLSFEQHEWDAHGVCAGATDAADFFSQVCALSTAPLAVMNATRYDTSGATDLAAMADALTDAGYSVFTVDTSNAQVGLAACAGPDAKWVLAAVADFPTVCGGWPAVNDDGGVLPGSCLPDTKGPACSSDAMCSNVTDCVRCASSGYCTDVPLSRV